MLQNTEKPNAPPKGRFYKGNYLVADDGRIFTMTRKGFLSIHQQKSRIIDNGYHVVNINGRTEYLHKIVAFCFVSNPSGYPEINHIDGDKENNRAENLEWCTRSQNLKHAFRIGLKRHEIRSHRLFSASQAKQIKEMLRMGCSLYSVAKIFNCAAGSICNIKHGRTYKEA